MESVISQDTTHRLVSIMIKQSDKKIIGEICGSHGGEYEGYCFLRCLAV
jgi:hypothetical protein